MIYFSCNRRRPGIFFADFFFAFTLQKCCKLNFSEIAFMRYFIYLKMGIK